MLDQAAIDVQPRVRKQLFTQPALRNVVAIERHIILTGARRYDQPVVMIECDGTQSLRVR